MNDRYAVMGNPVSHSKSPRIHSLFAKQSGHAIHYEAILVALDEFSQALDRFQEEGGCGLNVTIPFKGEAYALMDVRSPRAERAGAVNTILFRADGQRYGDNTDGIGLMRELTANHRVTLTGRKILVLGAGGAVRGVLLPLLAQHPARLVIANRSVDKAFALAAHFRESGTLEACGFPALAGQRFDLIINGTAAGLRGRCRLCHPVCSRQAVSATT
jgi:Shikimate 5-dehydrogenase